MREFGEPIFKYDSFEDRILWEMSGRFPRLPKSGQASRHSTDQNLGVTQP